MRRWLAILLLVFLPLQFSWAAVASYCGHETGAAAGHIGHHDHQAHGHAAKDGAPGDRGQADGTATGASGFDCAHCLGACSGLVDAVMPFELPALASAPQGLAGSHSVEHLPAPPERPQWATLA